MDMHNHGELNHRQYSFCIKYLSTSVSVCVFTIKFFCNLLQNPRLDFRLPLKCWIQMAMNKLKRKNSLRYVYLYAY